MAATGDLFPSIPASSLTADGDMLARGFTSDCPPADLEPDPFCCAARCFVDDRRDDLEPAAVDVVVDADVPEAAAREPDLPDLPADLVLTAPDRSLPVLDWPLLRPEPRVSSPAGVSASGSATAAGVFPFVVEPVADLVC